MAVFYTYYERLGKSPQTASRLLVRIRDIEGTYLKKGIKKK